MHQYCTDTSGAWINIFFIHMLICILFHSSIKVTASNLKKSERRQNCDIGIVMCILSLGIWQHPSPNISRPIKKMKPIHMNTEMISHCDIIFMKIRNKLSFSLLK